MSEIIRKWISDRLGVILDFNLLSFGEIVKDGNLIAQLLYNYGVLNSDVLNVVSKSENQHICLANLNYLNNALKTIGIGCSEKKIESLANGEGIVAMKLFYQLYLTLHNKNKLYYITKLQLKEEDILEKPIEELESEENMKQNIKKTDLDTTKALYTWHKNNYLNLIGKCRDAREKYIEHFKTNIKNEINNVTFTNEASDNTEHRLTDFINDIQDIDESNMNKITSDNKIYNCRPDKVQGKHYVLSLKEKQRRIDENKLLQTYMHKMLLSDLLNTLTNKQDHEQNALITNKLLKQSYYEKQMITKLLEIRNQKDTTIENRKLENELLLQKRNEHFVAELYQQQHNVSLAMIQNINERKRILELHKKLYNQKRERKYKRHYNICYDIISDFVDLAIKINEYQENYEVEVPSHVKHEWVSLFCTGEKILSNISNVEELLQVDLEINEKDEEFTAEIYRQNGLDEKDMSDYLNLESPWNLEEIETLHATCREVIELGENVLGYIVHKLLLIKYPLPQLPTAPELPKVFTASCVVGIKDDSLVTILEKILMKKAIIVVHLQAIINYCLKAYLNEADIVIVDKKLDEESLKSKKKGKGDKAKKGKKGKGGADKKGKKSKVSDNTNAGPAVMQLLEKETQTPNIYPWEVVHLSAKAQLGQNAYETLNLGLAINNRLLTAMFIEYLKSFKSIKGWVLVDYPENVQDAVALELGLTGKTIEENCVEDENESVEEFYEDDAEEYSRNDIFAMPCDIYELKRIAKLVPNTGPIIIHEKYQSYLNSFIRLIKNVETIPEPPPELGIDDFSRVEQFYEQFNCRNTLYYTTFDPETVKQMIIMITKDNVFGDEMYQEIIRIVFESVEEKRKRDEEKLQKLAKLGAKDKGKKSKAAKKDKGKKDKVGKGKKKSVSSMGDKRKSQIIEDQVAAAPPEVPEVIAPPPNPGEPNWNYVNIQQPLGFQIMLASFWEDVEEIYLNDFKQLFFQIRVLKNSVIPYGHDIYTHMTDFIERPDKKQHFLHKFQSTYNELDNDLREDDEFQTEMHCRILQFKSKLWDMCTIKMREAEIERIRIINENWFSELAIEFTDLFISAMQLEVDRSVNTFQILQDYYMCMVTQEPAVLKFNKIALSPFKNEKVFQFVADSYIDVNNNITKIPFNVHLEVVIKNSLQFLNTCYTTAITSVRNLEKVSAESKPAGTKKVNKRKSSAQEPSIVAEMKENSMRLGQEWQCAIEAENSRLKFRLHVLIAKAHLDLKDLVLYGENMFHDIYGQLDKRNQDELHSINSVCEIFHKATEACENIQPRLVLDGSKFYIDKTDLLYKDPFKKPHPFQDEQIMNYYFTIPQLKKLTSIYLDLAPNGSLPMKTFVYILEDIVVHSNNSDTHYETDTNNCILPIYWHRLKPAAVRDIIIELYGNVEYINWKDFIIFNLELPFPTEKELLAVRQQFRDLDPDKLEFVNQVQFSMVKFWFEFDDSLMKQTYTRKNIKMLLASLFEIREDCINYSALLLSFCKDTDPIVGVAKAFGLCIGKLICWNVETGLNYIEILRYQNFLIEQTKKDATMMPLGPESGMSSNVSETKFPSAFELYNRKEGEVNDANNQSYEYISEEKESFMFEDEQMVGEEEIAIYNPSPSLCYILPFHIILIIMTAALPWHTRVQCVQNKSLKEFLEVIYESVRNEEFQVIFAHEFLNCEPFKEYLMQNCKFTVKSPAKIIQAKIEKCKCNNRHNDVDE